MGGGGVLAAWCCGSFTHRGAGRCRFKGALEVSCVRWVCSSGEGGQDLELGGLGAGDIEVQA